jgi:hypothetical protein
MSMQGKPPWDAWARAGFALLLLALALVVPGRSAISQTEGARADPVDSTPTDEEIVNLFRAPTLAESPLGFTPPPVPAAIPVVPAASAGESAPLVPSPSPSPARPESPAPAAGAALLTPGGDGLLQTGCATCGGAGHLPSSAGGLNLTCASCGGSGCVPGRKQNQAFHYHTVLGRFFGNLYECLCCPDPCYEPSWIPEANAAFFVDYARPRTVQRFRWDNVTQLQFPDRNEFFWAREKVGKGGGMGPGGPKKFKNFHGEKSLDFNQFSFDQEAATEKASVFVEIPYRSTNPLYTVRHAGFADMNIGTKALFFDCELLQLAFQFRTYLPTGNAAEGLGTGHVSLEPSLLGTLRLAAQTYFQGQLSEWIPIGGNPQYQGSILHYHFSFNQVLLRFAPESPLIGTFEMSGWSFQTGSYTNPAFANVPSRYSGGQTYFSLGPGLRASICDRVDFGGAIAFPVTDPNWGDPWFRLELRVLY